MLRDNVIMADILEKIREQNRKRAARYYEKHKQTIAEKNKKARACLKNCDIEPKPDASPRQSDSSKESEPDHSVGSLDYVISKFRSVPNIKSNSLKIYVGSVKRIFKRYDIDNLVDFLNDDDLIQTLRDDNTTINTKKADVQTMLYCISNFFTSKVYDAEPLQQYFEELKLDSSAQTKEKQKEKVPTFKQYIDAIKRVEGQQSKAYLIAILYKEVPGLRDDLKSLTLLTKKIGEPGDNYILLPTVGKAIIHIGSYKTSDKYNAIQETLTPKTTAVLREYVKNNNIKEGDTVFGKSALSKYLNSVNKKLNLEITTPGVSLLRKMSVNQNGPELNHQERVANATRHRHSVGVQETSYVRNKKH